jgi:2-haloacid dehalogenase
MPTAMRRAVVFDVVGTLFSLAPVERKLGRVALEAWFERLLHSATSLTLAGEFRPFSDLAASTLKTTLAKLGRDVDPSDILEKLQQLPPQSGAHDAFAALERERVLIGTLTNSGAKQTQKLLERAGLEERVTEIVSVEEIELYKPHPAVYRHAAQRLGVDPKQVTLIAAHAWDVLGAKAAGFDAVWIDALEREWPFPKGKPRKAARDLGEAVELALR